MMPTNTNNNPLGTLVAMSGGVDSSVAALLMQQAGYNCTGATMRLFERPSTPAACAAPGDIADARAICARLHIEHLTLDLATAFTRHVIDPFIATYAAGATPNPCIECNRHLKFGLLLDAARAHGCQHIATGHYAQVEYNDKTGRHLLKRATNTDKDQSYVLYTLTQEQLAHVIFPLGGLAKAEVREIATREGFVSAQRPESQDICFIPNGDYAGFIRAHGVAATPGPIVDTAGRELGEHNGIVHFTVGQRKGIGIASSEPYYVVAIDAPNNAVVVGREGDLYSDTVLVGDINLIEYATIDAPLACSAKHRYRTPPAPATIEQLDATTLKVTFAEPQRAIAPGQSLVAYNGTSIIGGGRILDARRTGEG
jgi:tRNA-specific 2-thiouridylase